MMTSEVLHIGLGSIQVKNRIRQIDRGKIASLADSIKQIGLINPISVHSDYRLIAGMHRLEACKSLGWETIPAIVHDYSSANDEGMSALLAELAEIDENLIRNDLTELDQGTHHARRKRIYEALHPETKRGALGGKGVNAEILTDKLSVRNESYATDASAATGVTERTVQRKTRIGETLADVAEQLIGTAVEDNQSELLALAKLTETKPEVAAEVIERLVAERDAPGPVVVAVVQPAEDHAPTKTAPKPKAKPVSSVKDIVRDLKKEAIVEHLETVAAREVEAPTGLYDVIVIDPPWDMQKIERDVRPNQTAFDYPTMSEEELSAMTLPADDNCHVWVWTTHKFLPMSLRLIETWGLKYVCTFVWHKPGGFQPIGLPQYNAEFAVYARKGTPAFVDTKAFNTCFNAPRGAHSEKPEEFYEVVRRVTGGRRLDMFNRRAIDGFSTWGQEAAA